MSVKISGNLTAKLNGLLKSSGEPTPTVVVGYTQSYALVVHERTDLRHAEGKQAKYLEGPARSNSAAIAKIISESKDLKKGVLRAGLFLQRVSQEVVPIDTAALKASAFTAYSEEADAKAAEAYSRSEAVRLAELNRRDDKKRKATEKVAAKKAAAAKRSWDRYRKAAGFPEDPSKG